MNAVPEAAPVADVSEAFATEFKALVLAMSRSTAPTTSNNFAAVVACFRCGHIANDHRHNDAHECPTDPRVADRDMCPFRYTAVGCNCADMAWSKRDLSYEKIIAELTAQEAMLTDAVVGAVALVFKEVNGGPEIDAMTEELYQLREALIEANPRLQPAQSGRSS